MLEVHEDLAKTFSDNGLRCTRQRLAIYQTLAASRTHPTADELFTQLRDGGETSMSLATVYNTLEALCSAGLARKLPGHGGNGPCRYDADCGAHLHLRDRCTGDLADVPDDLGDRILRAIPRRLISELEARLGFKVEQLEIELVGQRIESPPTSASRSMSA